MNRNNSHLKRLVLLALFTAIVVVLQLLGSFIRLGMFSISLVLAPIVLGAALCGPAAGAYLGAVFGIAVLLSGDAALFLAASIPGTVITVLAKGILAGFAAGYIYKLFEKKSMFGGVILSALACPIVNTGIFLLGCRMFLMDLITNMAEQFGFGPDVGKYMIVGLVGLNFVVEVIVNLILSSAIFRLIKIGKKKETN